MTNVGNFYGNQLRTPRVLKKKKDGWKPLTISGKISNNVSGRELLGGPVSTITSSSASGEQECEPLTLLDILPLIVNGVHPSFLRTLGVRNWFP